MIPDIESPRLLLRHLDPRVLRSCLAGEPETAAEWLGAPLAAAWLDEQALMALRLDDIAQDPAYAPWSVRALLRREDMAMVGHANFHSLPGHPYLGGYGDVELGYTIYPDYRRQGYAREAVLAMGAWAALAGATRLVLSIAPDNLPSQALAAGLGFVKAGQSADEDGVEDVLTARWPLKGTQS
ncbi:RimJ/RimL family protein N-acetyltransferase [Chromobacterium alkanivorans]|uniref:GNAT family N-acetyltransferase n=1 Tax=Chromobacterium TaxID=535 RepID=UPI00069D91D0|nr:MULTISPECIES: GNAT family protein [Chromobacterium]MBN3003251.1 GNAT family N-acetyltransferase [Chromobacterium alkanivorans]MCS3803571.1 RimJ/RimL family protein N-acetyltransferase [Chromobacterium alkanivorans]MCS3818324.1 RimJ/RimL family protein N-acetyltransferase [Chromobacterium alkanivorans]MCS3874477.1 RimJ/RimL family protein N-acetyltransferase [Chromobacterium alkanivorans]